MRALEWALSRVKGIFGPKERVVKRYPLPPVTTGMVKPTGSDYKTVDDVIVRLDDLVLSVRRRIDVDVPFEVSVVVPRAEVTETYSEGKMVQRTLVYSSITIAHSPRFEGARTPRKRS